MKKKAFKIEDQLKLQNDFRYYITGNIDMLLNMSGLRGIFFCTAVILPDLIYDENRKNLLPQKVERIILECKSDSNRIPFENIDKFKENLKLFSHDFIENKSLYLDAMNKRIIIE